MSCGICALCGADLDACGGRTCDRRRERSRLVEVVTTAVRLCGAEGVELRRALRDAAWDARRAS